MAGTDGWWRRDRHADRRPALLGRNRVRDAVRAFFASEGFVEVDIPALQVSPGNETHLHAFATRMIGNDLAGRDRYLMTSPEFAMKKLVAAGETRIASFAPVFRNRERGPQHAPAFTMIEWYRTDTPYTDLIDDCAALLRRAAQATGVAQLVHRGATVDPTLEPERLTLHDAFMHHAGIDLLATLSPDPDLPPDRDALARGALAAGLTAAEDDTWSDIFSKVLVARVEPRIGRGRATVLMDYPAVEAALARRSPRDPRVAERFELYACGLELANAFGELTDPVEQRARFMADMDARERLYGERYPLDEDFLAALPAMPPTSGIALGFERLVMLATGADHIDQVIWAPVM
jgi:lysyl-tRNA synthetase class 2